MQGGVGEHGVERSPRRSATTLVPSVSLSYTPDYSDPSFGYYQDVRINNRKFINAEGKEQIGDIRRISTFDPRT
ncbi:MAG: putative LPS assembly protein LptD [Aquirufa sp.]